MSLNSRTGSAALWPHCAGFRHAFAAFAMAGVLSGCAGTPSGPFAGPDPADPSVPVASVGYRSTIGSYTRQRPVEPAPWREQNERVAPSPRQ